MKNHLLQGAKETRGFSLIELLVVIATLVVLVAILIPGLRASRQLAYRVQCGAHLRSVGQGLTMYDQDMGKCPPYYDRWGPVTQTYATDFLEPWVTYVAFHQDEVDNNQSMRPLQLALLYSSGYLESPEVLYCPAQTRFGSRESFTFQYYTERGRYTWGTHIPARSDGRPDDKIRTSYNYWLHGEKTLTRLSNRPVVLDHIQHWNAVGHIRADGNPAGINALFGDGHVRFSASRQIFQPDLWNGGAEAGAWDGPGNNRELFGTILGLLEH